MPIIPAANASRFGERALPAPDARTVEIAKLLSALHLSNDVEPRGSPDIEVFGPQVIRIFRPGDNHRFWSIDEREAFWEWLDGRFYMLRQVRNHPVWGPKLFAAFGPP